MILRPQLAHLYLPLFLCTLLTAAWPWPPSFSDLESLLVRRQDNNNNNNSNKDSSSASASPTKTASASGSAGSTQANSGKAISGTTSGGSGSAKPTASASQSGQAAQSTDVDPRLPPGGVNMLTPAPTQTTYYKIEDTVTFAWNYTSLSVTPSYVDVLVSCSANSATYTLAANASFSKTGSLMWDTGPDATGTAPLLTETYTLIVHDAAQPVSAVPAAGHLGAYQQFYFGMYTPQPYKSIKDGWVCAVCNAALSDTERQALKFMFGMCVVTVLSFTWFVGGFGGMI